MKTTIVKTFSTRFEAEIAKELLEANNIPTYMLTENAYGDPGFAYGGFKLYIREDQKDLALEILEEKA